MLKGKKNMSDNTTTLSEQVAILKALIATMEIEAPKVENGNRSATTRFRKAALQAKKISAASKKLASEIINNAKANKATENKKA
jgi:hypothetical protein